MLRFAVLVLVALSAWVGATSAAQPAEPLTLEIEHSRPRCTSGTLAEVSWNIRGGVPPYALSINGEAVDPGAPSARIPCGSAVDDALEWLLGIGNERYIIATATDAAGRSSRARARLMLVSALAPPTQVESRSYLLRNIRPLFRTRSGDDEPEVVTRSHSDAELRAPARYVLLRWRELGADGWTYESLFLVERADAEQELEWRPAASLIGRTLEIQLAYLRRAIERESPDALVWSPGEAATVAAEPRDLVAKATHDSLALVWGPDTPGSHYVAELSLGERSHSSWAVDVAPTYPYVARFDGLAPDTWYRVEIKFAEGYDRRPWSIDLRTEPAPQGWSEDLRLPRNVNAQSVEEGLLVRWSPPPAGPELGYRVCAAREDMPILSYTCPTVAVGVRQYILPLPSPASGSWRIFLSHMSVPAAVAERSIYVQHLADSGTVTAPPAPRPDVRHIDWPGCSIRAHSQPFVYQGLAQFSLMRDDTIHAEIAELEWSAHGRTRRTAIPSANRHRLLWIDTSEPVTFRIRYLASGVWTHWSDAVRIPLMPAQPCSVQIDEQGGSLIVSWRRPWHPHAVDGYRVYICCSDSDEVVVDAGAATSILYPTNRDRTEYTVSVAAYSDEGGEGRRSFSRTYRTDEPLRIIFGHSANQGGLCLAQPGVNVRVWWEIIGGAAPFLITIGDDAAFETTERRGAAYIECRADYTSGAAEKHTVTWQLSDYHGRAASATATISYAPAPDLTIEWRQRSVHETYVWLSWEVKPYGESWHNRYALRWRVDGEAEWRYLAGDEFLVVQGHDQVRRVRWSGLEPSTRYEFQLAPYDHSAQLEAPESLKWTPSETVTTLGPPSDVRLDADEEGLVVSWERQPDAWAYQVVLRTAGASWWAWHEPQGDARERVVFAGLDEDADYELEIFSPPLADGEQALPRHFEDAGPFGE